ncbi:MAG: DUF4235 domain-containing protein [Solirubrobacteraceae bacterium]|nr:DUF4235 domain-containing protein [Solirubrobacteraceae bacterium]
MKLLYAPFGLLSSVLGGLLAGAVLKRAWRTIADEDDAPSARESEYGWRQVLLAAALQGAVFGAVKAAVDRGGAEGLRRVTGAWPGD